MRSNVHHSSVGREIPIVHSSTVPDVTKTRAPKQLGELPNIEPKMRSREQPQPYTCSWAYSYRPNFLRGSLFFFPPRPPLPPRPPPRPLCPFPPLDEWSFRKGTKPLLACDPAAAGDSCPSTGAILGMRYLGTCFMWGCTRAGCRALSCRRNSRSSGLSSKCA